jgi:ABC-type tungstate transport system permease subunit
MELHISKIKIPKDCHAEPLKDGGVRFVRYKEYDEPKDTVTLQKDWGGTYRLYLDLPRQRELDTVITVTRTSVNCYRVIMSTPKETRLINCKTYDELNKSLNP